MTIPVSTTLPPKNVDETGSYQNPLSFFFYFTYRALLIFPVKYRTFKINVVAYLSLIVDLLNITLF